MTRRERTLLVVFLVTAVAVIGLLLAQTYLDQLMALDQKIVSLQRTAGTLQRQFAAPGGVDSTDSSSQRRLKRLLAPNTPLKPMVLAAEIKKIFAAHAVTVKEFQVIETGTVNFGLKYSVEGPMAPFLGAAGELVASDPHLLVLGLSVVEKAADQFAIVWEVGYASAP